MGDRDIKIGGSQYYVSVFRSFMGRKDFREALKTLILHPRLAGLLTHNETAVYCEALMREFGEERRDYLLECVNDSYGREMGNTEFGDTLVLDTRRDRLSKLPNHKL